VSRRATRNTAIGTQKNTTPAAYRWICADVDRDSPRSVRKIAAMTEPSTARPIATLSSTPSRSRIAASPAVAPIPATPMHSTEAPNIQPNVGT
jgi:hypothetical protein